MSWFSKYVGDPLKALLVGAEHAAEAELKVLAGQVAQTLPAAPITATAEVAFETALQTAMDGVLTAAVGDVPVVGAVLAPEVVTQANAALDYVVAKGTASLNALAAQAKARIAALSQAPAGGVVQPAPGAVG
jgi:hypothetical protein